MSVLSGDDILDLQEDLCKALGVDLESQEVASVTLEIKPAQLPTVTVKRWVTEGTHIKIKQIVKDKYRLERIDE